MIGQIIEVAAVLIGIYLVLSIGQGKAFETVGGTIGGQFVNAVTALQGKGGYARG